MRLNYTDELLREIDMYAGGNFLVDSDIKDDAAQRQKYLTRGIMEEAIASSQLEGADTSRRYAKKMIAENIKPRSTGEFMILNNYKTLSRIDDEYKDQDLSREVLLEIQAQLTENTFTDPTKSGRFRTDEDDIVVKFNGKIAHVPPEEAVLHKELDRLIAYANDDKNFIHPVIKAIILHFWIGYLHPFPDGNGRTARTIFYWYMLKHNYWAVAYLPISLVIKRAPARYAYSYIYTEQDNFDFTYFYDYNIKQIIKSIQEFKDYANRISSENAQINEALKKELRTNDRQQQIIHYILSTPDSHTTVSSHAKLSGITRQTAGKDINTLATAGLLRPEPYGNSIRYYATEKLKTLAGEG